MDDLLAIKGTFPIFPMMMSTFKIEHSKDVEAHDLEDERIYNVPKNRTARLPPLQKNGVGRWLILFFFLARFKKIPFSELFCCSPFLRGCQVFIPLPQKEIVWILLNSPRPYNLFLSRGYQVFIPLKKQKEFYSELTSSWNNKSDTSETGLEGAHRLQPLQVWCLVAGGGRYLWRSRST